MFRRRRHSFAVLVVCAWGCAPSVPEPRDGGGSETSTTTRSTSGSSATGLPGACEATESDDVAFCFGTPAEDGACVCTGDCLDESISAATHAFGGNCCYTPLDFPCATVGEAGLCCYTVRVEIDCGTTE